VATAAVLAASRMPLRMLPVAVRAPAPAPIAQLVHGDLGEEGAVVGAAVEVGRREGRRINIVSQGGRRQCGCRERWRWEVRGEINKPFFV
jgi:hypothetical protein